MNGRKAKARRAGQEKPKFNALANRLMITIGMGSDSQPRLYMAFGADISQDEAICLRLESAEQYANEILHEVARARQVYRVMQ